MEGSCQVSWSLDYLLGDKPEKAFFNVDEAKPNIPWQKKKKRKFYKSFSTHAWNFLHPDSQNYVLIMIY